MFNRILFQLLLLVLFIFLMIYGTSTLSTAAMKFPWIIGGFACLLLTLEIVRSLKAEPRDFPERERKASFREYKEQLFGLGWILVILPMIYFLGFLISIPLYLFIYLKSQGEKWSFCLIMTAIVGICFYFIFVVALELVFYEGRLISYIMD